uniref:Uncharacterized protein n=1 Tax=Lotus japonicus TaxID=34305 RepID=I3SDH5_LOTJA|nr:unknown [Lotus japonicus]
MFIIAPAPEEPLPSPPFLRYFSASEHIVNVPTESISRTVLNPFGERSSAETRKFPAAALTRMSIFPKCLKVDSTTLAASSCFRTSPTKPIAGIESDCRTETAESRTCFRRPMSATEAPCLPNWVEISKPIPEAPPVMRATFPFNMLPLNGDSIVN